MSEQNTKKESNQSISEGIKETAGSAFHTVHSALETTENAAMNTVDAAAGAVEATTNAVKNMAGNDDGDSREED